jgi:cytochrome c553
MYVVILLLAGTVAAAVAALPPPRHEFKNLKVLPKNINSKDLSRIMIDDFEDGLGVSCGFCHAEEKDSHRLDYASDAKPEKQIARLMMRMTLNINKKYFKLKHPLIGDSTMVISCATCHKRQPHPGDSE